CLATTSGVWAGYACLSNPCVFGVCIDDLNSTYSCYCIDGYTGVQCQTNWDECWSSPCHNGGTCIDGVAQYNCSCPEGFAGLNCEENLDECLSNPCQNGGVCNDRDNGYTCTCLPGFLGGHCEIDVAVCESGTSERCENGGECLEGPGLSFTCQCAPGWEGDRCEQEVDECASSPCQNGGVCVDKLAGYACACITGFTGNDCEEAILVCDDSPCRNDALCLMEDGQPVCYCVPDFHGEKCENQYDECLLGPGCQNGGTCIDGVDDFSCSCPPDLSGSLCECLVLTDGNFNCNYTRPPGWSLPPTTTDILSTRTTDEETETATLGWTTTASHTSSTVPTTRTTEEPTTPSTITTESEASESTVFSTQETAGRPESSTEGVFGTTLASTVTSEEPPTSTLSTARTTDAEILPDSTVSTSTVESSSLGTSTVTSTTAFFTTTEEVTTRTEAVDTQTTIDPFFTTHPSRRSTAEEDTTFSATESTTMGIPTTIPLENYTGSPDCMRQPCLSGGTCVSTSQGMRCMCRFNRQGAQCEAPLVIRHAAFSGNSYVSHRILSHRILRHRSASLEETLPMQVELRARTRASDGLILLATVQGFRGSHYLALFLHRGLLQFQFSCGLQTMLLSELEAPVNTGHEMVIHAALDFSRNFSHCNASLRVNDTLAMSGDQPTWLGAARPERRPGKIIQSAWLHLGGAPQAPFGLINDLPAAGGEGFTGCLRALKINGQPRQIFSDAEDGFGITECGSLACLANPCRNGAVCIELETKGEEVESEDDYEEEFGASIEDKWRCKCPTGYIGPTCEISVCADNPCQYGGTCVQFPGSGYLCLCPFGKHGHYCEHNLEVAQPTFSGSVEGLSSYVAYPVPIPLEYSLELTFKILPATISQISLLAFVGQSGFHDEKSDHMAVSFIQGYIMLTWNLGAGPRRIFTQRPIEERSENLQQPVVISVGRNGRQAWLSVDGKVNITGRAPGSLTRMDVTPIIFLGGHEVGNFSTLPHDLPLHSGFEGCIYDVHLKAGHVTVPLQDTKGVRGRGVGQCNTRECHRHACQHDGACLQHGATFTCICQEGWFGPLCTQSANPCDSENNMCTEGATCVPLVTGYECDCPTGRMGKNCEIVIKSLSDVSLTGRRSYVAIAWPAFPEDDAQEENEITSDALRVEKPHINITSALFNRPRAFKFSRQLNPIRMKFINEVEHPQAPQKPLMMLTSPGNVAHLSIQQYSIEFQVRPLSERGLLVFFGAHEDELDSSLGFVSLSLQGGVVEFRVSSQKHHVSVLRSSRMLAIGEWHKVRFAQSGKRLSLWVEGSATSASSDSNGFFLRRDTKIFLGGLPDSSHLPYNSISGFPVPFRGCIRQLSVSGTRIVLNETNILESRNIQDCDGTACGGDSCDLGGHCWLDDKLQPHCKCPENAKGDRCQIPESCHMISCKNRGKCQRNGECSCPNGWGGFYCEIATSKFSTPSFGGNSYLVVPPQRIPVKGKRNGPVLFLRSPEGVEISLNFSTTRQSGLLLWSDRSGGKFFGVGLERGRLRVASSALAMNNGTVDIATGGFISDGAWHNLLLSSDDEELKMSLDGRRIFSDEKHQRGGFNLTRDGHSITLQDTFFIGGFPDTDSVSKRTGSKFRKSFSGCLQDISLGPSDFTPETHIALGDLDGENIGVCEFA
ncbi:protein eyes shut, partial [Phlebotomus argentipes]|uniref:protein eyes shut n=1 Tax=Phlebotomus argentipes TaxID=94469 RepID=UPI0028935C8D